MKLTIKEIGEVKEIPLPSIAVDSNDKAHIVYNYKKSENKFDLRYCNNTGGEFSCITLEETDNSQSTLIVIDSKDNIHMVHTNRPPKPDDREVKYRSKVSGEWKINIMPKGMRFGGRPSIAIDSNNKVHIGYNKNHILGEINYCSGDIYGNFDCLSIEKGYMLPIAVDSKDNVQILFRPSVDQFKTKYCIKEDNGQFGCEELPLTQISVNVETDHYDRPHLFFLDENEGENEEEDEWYDLKTKYCIKFHGKFYRDQFLIENIYEGFLQTSTKKHKSEESDIKYIHGLIMNSTSTNQGKLYYWRDEIISN